MNRLHFKLSAAMLVIVALLGSAFYLIDRYSVRMYYEELSQRLNASLAMYVVDEKPLIRGGEVQNEALAELANRAMIINPTAEIYLLGPDGSILGHAFQPGEVRVDRVDTGPIRALLAESVPLPVKGIDPRDPSSRKVFSAFPVADEAQSGALAGYLYVVLGGAHYNAVADQVAGSDRQRMVAAAIALLVLAAFIAGVLLFSLLTRRLRRLTTEVTEFTAGDFASREPVAAAPRSTDEIDRLRNACHAMATTIRQQVASLQENDRLRRELVTNISHDLRTPLATMQGYIETLIIKDGTLDTGTRRQYLDVARRHASHLGKLIQDLFELAMLDASRVTPQFEEFSLTELIHDVVQEFELQARESEVALRVSPPTEPVNVRADISLIQRVLENLVSNALKYTPEGGRVSISVQPSAAGVGVAVADTGPGIPEQDLPHVFDRFYTVEPEPTKGNGSSGLGLAIAKRILELHGGEIVVTSEKRRGTVFRFSLPRYAAAA